MKFPKLGSLFVVILLCSCHSVSIDSKFRQQGYPDDLKELLVKQKITMEDRNLLDLYLTAHRNDSTLLSKSYQSLLEIARIDNELRKKRQELQAELNRSIGIKVLGKFLHVENTEEGVKRTVVIDITAKNNTDNKIVGFVAHINFRAANGIVFYDGEWPITFTISAHGSAKVRLSAGEYDNSNEPQMQLAMADLKKITIDYEISRLMYDDGTSKSVSLN